MWTELLAYGGYMGLGLSWQFLKPFKIPAAVLRRHLNALIYSVLLPAYLLLYLWQVRLGMEMLRQALMYLAVILLTLATSWLWLRGRRWAGGVKGALILATAFPAVFGLGLPLVSAVTGPWASGLALQAGGLVVLPLLFTLGSGLAHWLADKSQPLPSPLMLHEMPAAWAVAAGLLCNFFRLPLPEPLMMWLRQLSDSVVPLLLIAVGASLLWRKSWNRIALKLIPLILLSLLVAPLLIWSVAQLIGVRGPQTLTSMMLLAMMPAMTLGFSLCERYRLDMVAYNIMYTATSVLTLVTVPLLFQALQRGWLPLG
jgi:predicted permease